MLLLLPSAWLACFLWCRKLIARQRIDHDWRIAFMLACASWGALVTIGTEALSVVTLLNAPGVRFWWLAVNTGLWSAILLRRGVPPANDSWSLAAGWKEWRAWPFDAQVMLGAAAAFVLFLGGIALLTPSTNVDSLTYHMARVMHWIQNQSDAHYPTDMNAQLQMGPWPGFVETHLWLLWGNDHLENTVQWCALAGCAVTATMLACQLLPEETPRVVAQRTQALAAVLVVTMPTAVVQSITTQTDLTAGFWLLCFASLSLCWWRNLGNRVYAAGFGAVMGLGTLTKFTMVLYAAPIGLAFALGLLWKRSRSLSQQLLPGVILSVVIGLALAAPHLIRNQVVFGSMIGSPTALAGGGVSRISCSGVLSNLIRNVGLHSNTGIPPLTHALNRAAHTMNGWTGRALDDPELNLHRLVTFEPPDEFFVFDSFAASPWQMGLIGTAVAVGLAGARRNRPALFALGLAFMGAVLFCALLRWQIWNCRLHLPLLLLCMPIVAALLVPRMFRWLVGLAAAGVFAFAIVIVANNRSRPIFDAAWRAQSRAEQMLSFQCVQDYEAIRAIARQIAAADCQSVGLKEAESVDFPEYAFWVMLREAGFRGPIHHVLVEGPAGRLPGPAQRPDVIISALPGRPTGELAAMYPIATKFDHFTVYWSAEISRRRDAKPKDRNQ